MLTDQEVLKLAEDYVHDRYGLQYVAHRVTELSSPPGIYFGARLPGGPRPGRTGDDGGFFVFRASGELRHFSFGELLGAAMLLWESEGKPAFFLSALMENPAQVVQVALRSPQRR